MTELERLSHVAGQLLNGIMFHTQMIDLFDFLSLKGFYKWQKHQSAEEMKELGCLKHYVHKKYHMFLNIVDSGEQEEVIPESWKTHSALEATQTDIITTIKSTLDTYIEYEKKAKAKYHEWAEGSEEAEWICKLEKSACEEIQKIEKLKLTLQQTNYNPVHIQMLQDKYCEKYK